MAWRAARARDGRLGESAIPPPPPPPPFVTLAVLARSAAEIVGHPRSPSSPSRGGNRASSESSCSLSLFISLARVECRIFGISRAHSICKRAKVTSDRPATPRKQISSFSKRRRCYCRRLMTIEEAFVELENYVDASDPDMDSVSVVSWCALRCLSLPRRSYSSVLRSLRASAPSYSPLFD